MDRRLKSFMEYLKKVSGVGFSTAGGLWTVMQFCEFYFPNNSFLTAIYNEALYIFVPSISIAVIYGLYLLKYRCFIRYVISDKQIVIKPGNILSKRKGAIIVGINNQLITDPDKIGRKSLHREIVRRYGKEKIAEEFKKERKFREKQEEHNRKCFFSREINGKQFVFLMMSRIQKPEVAATSKDEIVSALDHFFNSHTDIRIDSNRLYCPLLGTGEGGINASNDEMANLIVREYVRFLKHNDEEVNRIKDFQVIVYWKDIFRVNFKEIRRKVDCLVENCYECSEL